MLLRFEEVLSICHNYSKYGSDIIFTNGCFDIFHIGHWETLRFAWELKDDPNDKVVVGINSDASIKKLKGEDRPIFKQQHRAAIIDSIVYTDYVFLFDNESVLPLILELKPSYLVKGGDTEVIVGEEEVKEYGGKVLRAPKVEDYSSSKIIEEFC